MAAEKPPRNKEAKDKGTVAPAEGAAPVSVRPAGAMKAMIAVAVVLLLEGGTIMGTMMLSGSPQESKGETIAADTQAALNKLVEVPLLKNKFDNQRTGRTYFYDTEIVVTVAQKNLDKFNADLEANKVQVQVDIQTLFRMAEPSVFQEPTRATLTRQIKASLDKRFGNDSENQPVVHEVLIAKCLPYRADY